MEQLCASCSYPKNVCETCPVYLQYSSLFSSDRTIVQSPVPNDSLLKLVGELKEEVHALTLEVGELKAALLK